MAHGDLIDSGYAYGKRDDPLGSYCTWYALDDAAGVTDGEWIDVRGFGLASVSVAGIGTATAHLCASNALTKPDNTTHGLQLGADITADKMVSLLVPVRWVKVRVSTWSSGTIAAIVHALGPGNA